MLTFNYTCSIFLLRSNTEAVADVRDTGYITVVNVHHQPSCVSWLGKMGNMTKPAENVIKLVIQRFSLLPDMPNVLCGTWYMMPFPYQRSSSNTNVAVGKLKCFNALTQTAKLRRWKALREDWKNPVPFARMELHILSPGTRSFLFLQLVAYSFTHSWLSCIRVL